MTASPARPAPCSPTSTTSPRKLTSTGYLPATATATAVFLADRLGKPLLVEGPAGVGKTELARAVAQATGSGLVRLQCYEGVDEARALYEWNHAKQILRIQSATGTDHDWERTRTMCSARSSLPATAHRDPPHRADGAADRRDRQGRHRDRGPAAGGAQRLRRHRPGTGHDHRHPQAVRGADLECHPRAIRGAQAPVSVPAHRLSRPRTRAAHPAVTRSELPSASPRNWCASSACCAMQLKKVPSVAETIDWGRTLLALGMDTIDDATIAATLGVVLKHQSDQQRAAGELRLN